MKTEIDVKEFAKALAHVDDEKQSDFINKFAYELKVGCKDPSLSGMQPCYISDGLDSNGRDFIKSLSEFLKLRKDNAPRP